MNKPASDAVGDSGSGPSAPSVFAFGASSYCHIAITRLHELDELLNIGWVVLTIAVEHHQDVTVSEAHPREEGATLTTILREPKRRNSFNSSHDLPGSITAAVVHGYHLRIGLALDDFLEHEFDTVFLVEEWNDNADRIQTGCRRAKTGVAGKR